MKQRPFFTVIIPVYNRAGTIARAIESVQQQQFSSWELIIVDDGSVDNTLEVVAPYLSDERINYIDQENKERSAARNKGIENATGEYICFLDSDDVYYPNHLREFHNALGSSQQVVFARSFADIVLNGKKNTQDVNFPGKLHPVNYILSSVIYLCNVCIHADILKKHKFNEAISYAEDTDLWVRILLDHPILVINKITTQINVASTGSKSEIHEKYISSFQLIFSNPQVRRLVSTALINSYFVRRYNWLIEERLLQGEKGKAFSSLIKLAGIQPAIIFKKQFYGWIYKLIF